MTIRKEKTRKREEAERGTIRQENFATLLSDAARACREGRNDLAVQLHPPRMRGASQYTGWVSQLRKPLAQVRDADARRFLESCRRMLEVIMHLSDFSSQKSYRLAYSACDTDFIHCSSILGQPIDISVLLSLFLSHTHPVISLNHFIRSHLLTYI